MGVGRHRLDGVAAEPGAGVGRDRLEVVLRHAAAIERRRRGRGPERQPRRRCDQLELDPVLGQRSQGEQQLRSGDASPGDQHVKRLGLTSHTAGP